MSRPVVNPGTLQWTGEHWINYLQVPGEETNRGMVSLYVTYFSAGGAGHVAFVDIAGRPEWQGVYTDNRATAAFVRDMIRGRGNPFDRELPVIDASFSRLGDVRHDPAWRIDAGDNRLVATWLDIEPPVIAEGVAPTFGPGRDIFTLLFFAQGAKISVDGVRCPGAPYERDIWRPSIGGRRSSCVFALAESFIKAPS